MKGGVTSGVVYPPAICELAQHYHFRSIGGTSAGAIAAAVTAAAEYQRAHVRQTCADLNCSKELPTRLGETDADGRSQLLRLFQPDPPCSRLFAVLVASLNQDGTWRRIGAILLGCISAYWIASVVSLAIAAAIMLLHSKPRGPLLGIGNRTRSPSGSRSTGISRSTS